MLKNIRILLGSQYTSFKKTVLLSVGDLLIGAIPLVVMLAVMVQAMVKSALSGTVIAIYTGVMLMCFLLRKQLLQKSLLMLQKLGSQTTKALRIRLGDHLQRLNLGYFNQKSYGYLLNTLTTEMHDLEVVITHHISDLLKHIILLTLLSAVSFFLSPVFAAVQLLVVLSSIAVILLGVKSLSREGRERRAATDGLVSKVVEYVEGIQVFKSFGVVGANFKRLNEVLLRLKKSSRKTEFVMAPNLFAARILMDISFPLFLFWGAGWCCGGVLAVSSFILFLMLNLMMSNILKAALPEYVLFRKLNLACENLTAVENQPEMPYKAEQADFAAFDVEFKNIHFSYEPNIPVLCGVSFLAKAGRTTALVGPSGSGKTTITSLIARFWDPAEGHILIGSRDIRDIHPNEVLRYISMVFQDVYLIQDTVYENIRIGREDATMEEVVQAARAAHCHDFILKMEDGYNTVVGEGGSTLSAGERQRISIARALLKNAPVVLLDEATASLDADNEYEIRAAIKQLTAEKTVIMIAHRLNTIRDADQIIVLKDGTVLERGTHDELITREGWYCDRYRQMEKAEEWQMGK